MSNIKTMLEYLRKYSPKAILDETPELMNLLQEFGERQLLSYWSDSDVRYFYTESGYRDEYGRADVFKVLNSKFGNSICFTSLFEPFIKSLKQIEEFLNTNDEKLREVRNILTKKYKINPDELAQSIGCF